MPVLVFTGVWVTHTGSKVRWTLAREYYAKAQTSCNTEDHLAIIEVLYCLTGTAWTYFLQGQSTKAQQVCTREP